jgi:aminoglycoside 3-N-acetyltransferase
MIRQLDIKPGSMVWVAADLTRMALAGRRIEPAFDINDFISIIKQCLGKGGTLIIPAFNFNLKNNDHFIPSKSLPITGAMAVAAMKRPEFIRTKNPLHSFLVWGEYAEELAALDNRSSFSEDSPFAFMMQHGAKMLLIDTTITAAFTFVHHVEEMERVGYRKFRRIGVFVEEEKGRNGDKEKGRKEVLLYAKKPGWTMDLSGLEKLLFEKNIANKQMINKIAFTLVDLQSSYQVIKDDIDRNNAKNLARFSFGLYIREKAKTALAAAGFHTVSDKISHDPGLL